MKLRFVGEDGSLGLKHGKVYDVTIGTTSQYLWVSWDSADCPYTSTQAFAENWQIPKEGT